MKRPLLLLLLIPYALLSGLAYGLLASKLVRDKEPWFTLLLLGGLATTIALITWLGGIPMAFAAWTFVGSASFYLLLRLLFGKSSAMEMLCAPHMIAIVTLLFWPAYERAKQKVERQLSIPAAP